MGKYYAVDLEMRRDTLARLDATAVALDLSVNGFVVAAVAEYLQRKGFAVGAPKPRRRYRDQAGIAVDTSAYKNNETTKAVAMLTKRAIFFPNDWRGCFTQLYIREKIEAKLAVRAAVMAKFEQLKGSGVDVGTTAARTSSVCGTTSAEGSDRFAFA